MLPKTTQELPLLIGVLPNFAEINSLKVVSGRFFTAEENDRSAPVCVLGETAKVNLLGFDPAVGKYVKVNDLWLQVIGVLLAAGHRRHRRRRHGSRPTATTWSSRR